MLDVTTHPEVTKEEVRIETKSEVELHAIQKAFWKNNPFRQARK